MGVLSQTLLSLRVLLRGFHDFSHEEVKRERCVREGERRR